MKKLFNRLSVFAAVVVTVALLAGCRSNSGQITQVSTINALMAGAYQGQMACGELLQYGNCGVGTFDSLDGEMLILDGTVYQIKADGKVYRPNARVTTPFACVVDFKASKPVTLKPCDMKQFTTEFDAMYPDTHLFYAVRVDGKFKQVVARSVPRQHPPYKKLVEVAKNQKVFTLKNVEGTIFGIRCPEFVKGLNVPGYHLHFITKDRTKGGHVLSFQLKSGQMQADSYNVFKMILPVDSKNLKNIDMAKDRSHEIEKVEK
ncbi:acetolactate decarboxylase [Lentisphaerota bacterium ZTH]|nr:acetolactate decarboxylase [Lentisphaerota bacterium]WET07263.1 acetolactate decarboxylase [Lentisphaerota bacterium ZTH]